MKALIEITAYVLVTGTAVIVVLIFLNWLADRTLKGIDRGANEIVEDRKAMRSLAAEYHAPQDATDAEWSE